MTMGSWIMDDLRDHRRSCPGCEKRMTAPNQRPFFIPLTELCTTGKSLYRAWWEWCFEMKYPLDEADAALSLAEHDRRKAR